MTVYFYTGFDHYTTILQRWTTTNVAGAGTSATITSSVGRNGTNGLRSTVSTVANSAAQVSKTLTSSLTTFYCNSAIRLNALPSSVSLVLLEAISVTTSKATLAVNPDGTLTVTTTSFTQVVPDFVLSLNTYYHIEMRITFNATTGVAQVWINEVLRLNASNQNTGTGTANVFRFGLRHGSGGGGNIIGDFDDVHIADTGPTGDKQLIAIYPVGTGTTNNWGVTGASNGWEAVDETPPNTSDYIASSTVTDISLFTMGDIASNYEIFAVQTLDYSDKTDAGTAQHEHVLRVNATNYNSATTFVPSNSSPAYNAQIWETSPDTGVTWTILEVNALEFGPERTA